MFAFGSSGSRSGSRCESGELKSMQKNERSDVPSNTLKPHIQAICYARIPISSAQSRTPELINPLKLWNGMRENELLRLPTDLVDFHRNMIYLRNTKGDINHEIPMNVHT